MSLKIEFIIETAIAESIAKNGETVVAKVTNWNAALCAATVLADETYLVGCDICGKMNGRDFRLLVDVVATTEFSDYTLIICQDAAAYGHTGISSNAEITKRFIQAIGSKFPCLNINLDAKIGTFGCRGGESNICRQIVEACEAIYTTAMQPTRDEAVIWVRAHNDEDEAASLDDLLDAFRAIYGRGHDAKEGDSIWSIWSLLCAAVIDVDFVGSIGTCLLCKQQSEFRDSDDIRVVMGRSGFKSIATASKPCSWGKWGQPRCKGRFVVRKFL